MQVSVIIPTRNRPDFLAQAIASVRAQSFRTFELIFVNDGDSPLAPPDDARIRVLTCTQHGGVHARQMGVDAARGDALAFVDDDDAWTDSAFLQDAVNALGQGADFVFGDGTLVTPDGHMRIFAQDADVHSLARDNTILASAIVYRRGLHNALGGFDINLPYYADWDWYLRVARAGYRLQRLTRPVAAIRLHDSNMSHTATDEARRANLEALCRKHGLGPLPMKRHVDFTES